MDVERVGYLCTFTPKEIIHAAGFHPVRLLAGDVQISSATAHIQSYACSHAKGCLELALNGELDVSAVVFTRSCDTLMRLADIWERNTDMKVYSLEFPVRVDKASREFFVKELMDFVSALESWGGKVTAESLEKSLKIYRELETLLDALFRVRPDYELLMKVQSMMPEDAVELVRRRLDEVKDEGRGDKKVLLTGSVCPFPEIYEIIRNAGFDVIDDLCTGTRFFTFLTGCGEMRKIESVEDGIRLVADKYFAKAPCPTKHYPGDWRMEYVLNLAEECDGVIFLLLKFCDPHFFDFPQLRERLEEKGKKTLLIELEFPLASLEQIRTRVEAFYELISG